MLKNKTIVKSLLGFFLLSVLIYLFSGTLFPGYHLARIIYLIACFFPVVAAFYALKLYGMRSAHGHAFLFIALAFLALFIGEVIWVSLALKGLEPFPSVADYFYILFYPLLFIGLAKELKLSQSDATLKKSTLEFIMAGLALMLILLMSYIAYDSQVSWLKNSVAIAYVVGDLVLVFLVLLMLKEINTFKGGHLFYAWLAFSIGLGITLLTDLVFAIYAQVYAQGRLWIVMDLLWIASFLMFSLGLFSLSNAVRGAQKKVRDRT